MTQQLELGVRTQATVNIRQQRQQRARWWFGKMRQVVDLAMPPQAMVAPRPEQTYLRLSSLRAPGHS